MAEDEVYGFIMQRATSNPEEAQNIERYLEGLEIPYVQIKDYTEADTEDADPKPLWSFGYGIKAANDALWHKVTEGQIMHGGMPF